MSLISNKFLLFGGKGGVGKTTCATSTGLYSSFKGKKTLVLSTDPAHSLSDSFNVEIGNKITPINENLDALEIDASILLEEYKQKYGAFIKQIADEGTFFSREEIQKFFDLSLPGMDELMALLKIIDILEEEKYDLIILDTAPTGHTIRLLELPDVMVSYVKVLAEMRQKHRVMVRMAVGKYIKDEADNFMDKMYLDIQRLKNVLKDQSTKFVPVLIPEIMSISETERLLTELEKHFVRVEEIIVNNVVDSNCKFCSNRRKNQEKYLKLIAQKFSKYSIKQIPLLPKEIQGEELEKIYSILYEKDYVLPKLEVKDSGSSEVSSGSGSEVSGSEVSSSPNFVTLSVEKSTEFLLLGGKGGVGKTSCASAIALRESKHKKVLIFSTDPAHSLSDSFGVSIGNEITNISENLDALEINSYDLLAKFKQMYVREIQAFFNSVLRTSGSARIDAPFDRKVMADLFDLCPPGIDEIMALKIMMDLMKDKKYDLFILDTAPTGHTIRLLEMPEIVEEWVQTLIDLQDHYPLPLEIGDTLDEILYTLKKVRTMLKDKTRSEFVIVSIPEMMSVLETQDLVSSLKRLDVYVENVIINKLVPESRCTFCSPKRKEQLDRVKKLQDLGLKLVSVSLLDHEITGKDSLLKLGEELYT